MLVNSFNKNNGMIEAKCFLFKRFVKKLTFEQESNFIQAMEKCVFDKSLGNILIVSLNPVKSACLLIELLEKVKNQYTFL